MSCDVTSVVATAETLKILRQFVKDTLMDMFARLSKHFWRASVDRRETRERKKRAGLAPESNEGLKMWFGVMWIKYWEWKLSFLAEGLSWPF